MPKQSTVSEDYSLFSFGESVCFSVLSIYPWLRIPMLCDVSPLSPCFSLFTVWSWWLIKLSWPPRFYSIPFFMSCEVFFFFFSPVSTHWLHCKINPKSRPKALRHIQGQVRCVNVGGLLPSLIAWCHIWMPSVWRNSRRSQCFKICFGFLCYAREICLGQEKNRKFGLWWPEVSNRGVSISLQEEGGRLGDLVPTRTTDMIDVFNN